MEKRLFTSECVTNGHPDKVADSISDAMQPMRSQASHLFSSS